MSSASRLQEKVFGVLSLAVALAAFHGLFWCVFLYPGLLGQWLAGVKGRKRVVWAAGWGVAFSLLFYHWVGGYGLLPWVALALVRGLPWALYPTPELVWRWWRQRQGKSEPGSEVVRVLAGSLGLGLVSQTLLLGITGVDWETPAALLTPWPSLLLPLPWLGLAMMAVLIGLVSHLLVSKRLRPIFLGLALLGLWIGAAHALWRVDSEGPGLPVALVQTGFSQDEKWDSSKREQGVEQLLQATSEAAQDGAELVIWPETAWPYRGMRRRVTNTRKIGKAARTYQIDILASSIEEVPDERDPDWVNSVSLVLSSGRFTEHYEKRRLAPFAEYMPLPRGWQPRLRAVSPFSSISRFVPGSTDVVLTTSSGHKFAVMICYESMTPRMAGHLASQVDFLVVVTNDAPFRHSQPNEAHFRSAILRAVETGKPVLQAANTGVSGAIASNGRVLLRTPVGFSGPNVQHVRP